MLTARNIADTRPSMALGVTVCRSVVDVMVQMMGPAPNRKNDRPANVAVGKASVATMVSAARTETAGPNWMARPKGRAATTRGARSAPSTMPTP